MITSKMRKWLEQLKTAEKPKNRYELLLRRTIYSTYMRRIQKRIEKELDMLLWLAVHKPEVLKGKDQKVENERLKKLLLTLKAVNPKCEAELVLEILKEECD